MAHRLHPGCPCQDSDRYWGGLRSDEPRTYSTAVGNVTENAVYPGSLWTLIEP